MGLDMYLYKATKPSLTFGIYRSDDIYIQSLALIPNDEHNEEMYSAIKPYMVRIQLESSEYDAEKIAKDYGLKGRIGICSISPDGVSFRGENKTTDYIPQEIIKKHYSRISLQTVYAVELKQVYYWRKAYDVQDAIHNALDCCIENCGYYLISDDVADVIKEIDDGFDPEIVKRESDSCIFYHEWY